MAKSYSVNPKTDSQMPKIEYTSKEGQKINKVVSPYYLVGLNRNLNCFGQIPTSIVSNLTHTHQNTTSEGLK